MFFLMNFTTSKDINGNKTLKVKIKGYRTFSIQTLANLPATHRNGVCSETKSEVVNYVNRFGTRGQKLAINQ